MYRRGRASRRQLAGARVKCVPILCVLPRKSFKNPLWTEDRIEIRRLQTRTDKFWDARNRRRCQHHSLSSPGVNSDVEIRQVRVPAGLVGQHQHLRN